MRNSEKYRKDIKRLCWTNGSTWTNSAKNTKDYFFLAKLETLLKFRERNSLVFVSPQIAQRLTDAQPFWRIIYTTNAIESVNMSLRKITKNRGAFPSDEALFKLFYLALNNTAAHSFTDTCQLCHVSWKYAAG